MKGVTMAGGRREVRRKIKVRYNFCFNKWQPNRYSNPGLKGTKVYVASTVPKLSFVFFIEYCS
jgi:hypothetical protein